MKNWYNTFDMDKIWKWSDNSWPEPIDQPSAWEVLIEHGEIDSIVASTGKCAGWKLRFEQRDGTDILTLAATSELEALARAQNWIAVQAGVENAVAQTLQAIARAGRLRFRQRSWGWLALESECTSVNVYVLYFDTALVIGGIDDNDTLILMDSLATQLQRAAVPAFKVARVVGSHRDAQNNAAAELNRWLAQAQVVPQLTRLALELPLTAGKPTKGEEAVLNLVADAWQATLAIKAMADERDRRVFRRLLKRWPGYKLSGAALASLV